MTYNVSFKTPFISSNLVINEIISTTRYSIDSIITTHYTTSFAISHTCFKGWEISLQGNDGRINWLNRWMVRLDGCIEEMDLLKLNRLMDGHYSSNWWTLIIVTCTSTKSWLLTLALKAWRLTPLKLSRSKYKRKYIYYGVITEFIIYTMCTWQ